MRYEPTFEWQEDIKTAICTLTDGKQVFYGMATCAPDDYDMCSEKTGCEIAFKRAKIKYLRYYRDTLKFQLKALNQLFYSMNKSLKFNPKSYENRMLQRQIRMINFDLATAKEMIATEEQELKSYIEKKDMFYTRIRKNRDQKDKIK